MAPQIGIHCRFMKPAPVCVVLIGRRALSSAAGAALALFAGHSFAQNAPLTPLGGGSTSQNATAPREELPQRPASPPTPGRRSFDYSVPDFGSAPLRFDVARVEVVQAYAPPQRPPNLEHRMMVSPLAALDDWARRHIEPAAGSRDDSAVVFVIEDASVVVEKIRSRKSLIESLIRDDAEKFTLRLAVTLQVRDRLGTTLGGTSAEASAWRTAPESMKDADRSAMLHDLLIAAMDNLVPAFEANARAYLARFLK
jgi:hypothetical protein